MADAQDVLLAKGEFARAINVSPGRVTQMITEGKIGPDALVGEGRSARIRLNLARQQIAARTDIGQRFGNGISTQLDFDAPPKAGSSGSPAPAPASDPIADEIKRERLLTLRLANQRAAEDRLAEQGRYVRADHTRTAMTKMAGSILTIFEGGLADLADALAAKHGLAKRDVLHTLRAEFRNVRLKATEAFTRDLADLPKLLADDVPDVTDTPQGEA